MNEVILFGIICLIVLRFLALIGSIDFFYITKDINLVYLSIGWGLEIIAGFCPIISSVIENITLSNLFLFLNSVFIALGSFVIVMAMIKYIMTISNHYIIIMVSLLTSISLMMYLLLRAPKVSILFNNIVMNLCSIIITIILLFKSKSLKMALGKSIRWYFVFMALYWGFTPLSAVIYSQGYEFGMYTSNNNFLIMVNYGYGILLTSVQIVFVIHVEFKIRMNQNIELKDKYSHELGNILQTIYSSIQLVRKNDAIDDENIDLLNLSEEKCLSAAKFLKNIRKL